MTGGDKPEMADREKKSEERTKIKQPPKFAKSARKEARHHLKEAKRKTRSARLRWRGPAEVAVPVDGSDGERRLRSNNKLRFDFIL